MDFILLLLLLPLLLILSSDATVVVFVGESWTDERSNLRRQVDFS